MDLVCLQKTSCLFAENTPNKSESNAEIVELTSEVLNYLDKRMEFWQQQKPAQKSAAKKAGGERRALRGGKDDPKQWVLRSLEEIDEGTNWVIIIYNYI